MADDEEVEHGGFRAMVYAYLHNFDERGVHFVGPTIASSKKEKEHSTHRGRGNGADVPSAAVASASVCDATPSLRGGRRAASIATAAMCSSTIGRHGTRRSILTKNQVQRRIIEIQAELLNLDMQWVEAVGEVEADQEALCWQMGDADEASLDTEPEDEDRFLISQNLQTCSNDRSISQPGPVQPQPSDYVKRPRLHTPTKAVPLQKGAAQLMEQLRRGRPFVNGEEESPQSRLSTLRGGLDLAVDALLEETDALERLLEKKFSVKSDYMLMPPLAHHSYVLGSELGRIDQTEFARLEDRHRKRHKCDEHDVCHQITITRDTDSPAYVERETEEALEGRKHEGELSVGDESCSRIGEEDDEEEERSDAVDETKLTTRERIDRVSRRNRESRIKRKRERGGTLVGKLFSHVESMLRQHDEEQMQKKQRTRMTVSSAAAEQNTSHVAANQQEAPALRARIRQKRKRRRDALASVGGAEVVAGEEQLTHYPSVSSNLRGVHFETSTHPSVSKISCHQCHKRRAANDSVFCTRAGMKTKVCQKKYCKTCLHRYYDADLDRLYESDEVDLWICPGCHSACSCGPCTRMKNNRACNLPLFKQQSNRDQSKNWKKKRTEHLAGTSVEHVAAIGAMSPSSIPTRTKVSKMSASKSAAVVTLENDVFPHLLGTVRFVLEGSVSVGGPVYLDFDRQASECIVRANATSAEVAKLKAQCLMHVFHPVGAMYALISKGVASLSSQIGPLRSATECMETSSLLSITIFVANSIVSFPPSTRSPLYVAARHVVRTNPAIKIALRTIVEVINRTNAPGGRDIDTACRLSSFDGDLGQHIAPVRKIVKRPLTPHELSYIFAAIRPPVVSSSDGDLSLRYVGTIRTTLRHYQVRAVQWMVQRETGTGLERNTAWEECRGEWWFHNLTGALLKSSDKPPLYQVDKVQGGILSEEMGLGKTLEVLCLICSNRSPENTGIQRMVDIPLGTQDSILRRLPCIAATLIVIPPSLVGQWLAEIQRHCFPEARLSVLHYEGCRESSRSSDEWLALFHSVDVVLTTYETLASEVNYSKRVPYSLRANKVYEIPSTPLLSVSWWRLVLDEAQMVKNPVSTSAEMASRIHSMRRWCVTGTPFDRQGLNDLYGIMCVLSVVPWCVASVWQDAFSSVNVAPPLQGRASGRQEEGDDSDFSEQDEHDGGAALSCESLRNLVTVLQSVMWRHSKADVKDELPLPALMDHVVSLSFNEVERDLYDRALSRVQAKVITSARQLNDNNAAKHLLLLRHACSNPQAAHQLAVGNRRRMLTMPQIAKELYLRATDDMTASERVLCRDLNTLGVFRKLAGNRSGALNALVRAWKIADSGVQAEETTAVSDAHKLAAVGTAHEKRLSFSTFNAINAKRVMHIHDDEEENDKEESGTASGAAGAMGQTHSSASDSREPGGPDLIKGGDIVTANAQVRQWRLIETVTTYHLMQLYESVHAEREKANLDCAGVLLDLKRVRKQHEHIEDDLMHDSNLRVRDVAQLIAEYEAILKVREQEFSAWERMSPKFSLPIISSEVVALIREQSRVGVESFARNSDRSDDVALVYDNISHARTRILNFSRAMSLFEDVRTAWQFSALLAKGARPMQMASVVSHLQLLPQKGRELLGCRTRGVVSALRRRFTPEGISETADIVLLRVKQYAANALQRLKRAYQRLLGRLSESDVEKVTEMQNYEQNSVIMSNFKERCDQMYVMLENSTRALRVFSELRRQVETQQQHHEDQLWAKSLIEESWIGTNDWVNMLPDGVLDPKFFEGENESVADAHRMLQKALSRVDRSLVENIEATLVAAVRASEVQAAAKAARRKYVASLQTKEQSQAAVRAPPKPHGGSDATAACSARSVEQVCLICQGPTRDVTWTPCGHMFCATCVMKWVRVNGTCPMCRFACTEEQLLHIVPQSVGQRGGPDAAAASSSDTFFSATDLASVKLVNEGDWGTKVNAIIRRLLWLSREDSREGTNIPSAPVKSLVFSQFRSVLEIIARVAQENGIKTLHLAGGNVRQRSALLNSFQTDPSVQVLCMPMMHDSSGLTLVQASHVFLCEPSLSVAVEQQCISRVHRMGQDRTAHVHRFVIRDSIEERIMQKRRATPSVSAASRNGVVDTKKQKKKRTDEGKYDAGGSAADSVAGVESSAMPESSYFYGGQNELLGVPQLLDLLAMNGAPGSSGVA